MGKKKAAKKAKDRATSVAVAAQPSVPVVGPKYTIGLNYSVPKTIADSGVIQLVGCEDSAANKFIKGSGWVYAAVTMPDADTAKTPRADGWFHVSESELDQWKSQHVGPKPSEA